MRKRTHKRTNIFLFFITFILIISIILVLLALFIPFKLKNVTIKKINYDFYINNDKFLEYLNIKPGISIWSYKTALIKEKIDKLYYISNSNVYKRFPNSIVIEIKIREPIAKLSGYDSEIFLIDIEGYVYRDAFKSFQSIPVIIFDNKDDIKPGIVLKGKSREILEILDKLKSNFKNIYSSISQIEVSKNKYFGFNYVINYKTYNYRIYLKNFINVDSIKRGLAFVIYMNSKDYDSRKAYYAEKGFILF
ncbi:MAG: FtsQ-type POTRA domain-containing protein [Spirochaetes bacterium]|nr:FtsQ-type POTRA domain-containing protein [Spirochaetota bacterium]